SVSHSHPMSPLRWNVGTTPSSSIPAKSHSLRERFQVGVLRNVRSEIAHANRNPHRQPSSALAAAARPTGQCAQHSRVHINQALASRNKSSFNPLRSDLPFINHHLCCVLTTRGVQNYSCLNNAAEAAGKPTHRSSR